MKQFNPGIQSTTQHFEILDGLRGIAALAVVIFHFAEIIYPTYDINFIGHGFLAVDFFFCLSGFVIGYAYDKRITTMGTLAFFKARIIRLHPMVIMGSIFGLLGYFLDPFGGHTEPYGAGKTALIFLGSILLIPLPVMPERFFNLFSFNAPAWSLFWEYVANIFYALVLYRLGRKYLLLMAVLAAVALCFICFRTGNLLGGWSGPTFWDGGTRVAYSFTAGLLVYRYHGIIKNKLGFPGLALLLALAFLSPFSKWNWITEPSIILFYFPFIVALGAGATLTQSFKKLCTFSGKLSYTLYMSHYWALWIFGNYYASHKPGTTETVIVVITGAILLVGFAWVVMVVYDTPVRKYLTRVWGR